MRTITAKKVVLQVMIALSALDSFIHADNDQDLELGPSASQPTAPPSGSTESGTTRDSSHIIHEEHPGALSVFSPAAEGDHVVDDQNHTRTPSSQQEASSSQSSSPPPTITIESNVVAA